MSERAIIICAQRVERARGPDAKESYSGFRR